MADESEQRYLEILEQVSEAARRRMALEGRRFLPGEGTNKPRETDSELRQLAAEDQQLNAQASLIEKTIGQERATELQKTTLARRLREARLLNRKLTEELASQEQLLGQAQLTPLVQETLVKNLRLQTERQLREIEAWIERLKAELATLGGEDTDPNEEGQA